MTAGDRRLRPPGIVAAGGHPEAGLPNSATPCATAHGAHSATSTAPFSPSASRRLITARLSHIPTSSGCDLTHTQSQSCRVQTSVMRQLSSAARTAGSLASLWNASLVTAAVWSAHSATMPVAASQAAASARTGFSSPLLTFRSSHPGPAVANPAPAMRCWPGDGLTGQGLLRPRDDDAKGSGGWHVLLTTAA